MGVSVSTRVSRVGNYYAGAWHASTASEFLPIADPANGEVLAEVPMSSSAEATAVIEAAAAAFPEWRRTPPEDRIQYLFKLKDLLERNLEDLARQITLENGKTLAEARAELRRGIENVEVACGIPTLMQGFNLEDVARGIDEIMIRQPLGVVAAITPFNFPAMIPLWFLPFALATGNGIVLKPSERDPVPASFIFELLDGIEEIPAGIAALVHGAREAVDALLTHPGVDAISFVGQAATARHVAETATRAGKRVQALGGAKNSMIVMPDADLALAVPAMLASAFGSAGQRCLAGSVAVLVGEGARRAQVRERLVEAAAGMRVGAGGDPATDVPPVIAPEARERVADAIEFYTRKKVITSRWE